MYINVYLLADILQICNLIVLVEYLLYSVKNQLTKKGKIMSKQSKVFSLFIALAFVIISMPSAKPVNPYAPPTH